MLYNAVRQDEIETPTLFGEIKPRIHPSLKLNKKQRIDGLELLKKIDGELIRAAFFDPQYRGDMITWDKGSIGMGYRTRRRAEYLVVIQKEPILAKSTWTLHNIPDVWLEKLSQKNHTHSKPIQLQKQLILATTKAGDLVPDPASGGYSVLEACKEAGRDFIGGDIIFGEDNTQA